MVAVPDLLTLLAAWGQYALNSGRGSQEDCRSGRGRGSLLVASSFLGGGWSPPIAMTQASGPARMDGKMIKGSCARPSIW